MDRLLTLQCPTCGARGSFYSGDTQFECAYCGNRHIFQVPTVARSGAATPLATVPETPAAPAQRPLAPRPRQVLIERQPDALILRWRWFSIKYLPMLFFAIFWDGFLCFWYSMAFNAGGGAWIMLLFPLIHVAVGVGLTYYVIAGLLNTSTLRLTRQQLTIQHDPVPWPGEVKKPADQLEQLYCKEKYHRTKNGSYTTYQLCAVMKDGRTLDMASNLETAELAAFIEQQVETWLNITDRPVAGEM